MSTDSTAPKAPRGLGPAGRGLWASITQWSVDGQSLTLRPDELMLLAQACKVADTISELEADTEGEPTVQIGTSGQERTDPLIVELRLQRNTLSKLLKGISVPEVDSENAWDHLTASQRARKAARAKWTG